MEFNGDTVVGIGSALMDILAYAKEAFLSQHGIVKGGMVYADNTALTKAVEQLSAEPQVVPGGAACNTIMGIARLGGKACFIGKRGQDQMGENFETALKENHVIPHLMTSSTPTGKVLSVITEDAERSMLTLLGASAEMRIDEISAELFQNAAIVLVEGYMLYNRDLIIAVLQAVKSAGARVALDLSSFTVVQENKAFIKADILPQVDILLANEDEAYAFTGVQEDRASLEHLQEYARIAVLKVGKRGSYIAFNGDVSKIEPAGKGDVKDTTGAGDLWAAGFLYGLVNGYPPKKCGALASLCGYEVCQVIGASIPDEGWQRIHQAMAEL